MAEENGEVSAMMQRVAMSSEDSDARRELLPKIREELLAHAKTEENEFYSVLRGFDSTRDMVSHSKEEHDRIVMLLDSLQASNAAESSWLQTFKQLVDAVQSHVDEEENEIFPKASEALGKARSREIEDRYVEAKKAEMKRLG